MRGRSLCRKKSHSRQRLCGFESLFGPRVHKKVLTARAVGPTGFTCRLTPGITCRAQRRLAPGSR